MKFPQKQGSKTVKFDPNINHFIVLCRQTKPFPEPVRSEHLQGSGATISQIPARKRAGGKLRKDSSKFQDDENATT